MLNKVSCIILLLLVGVMSASAQFVTPQDLEKYAEKKYGDSWVKTAKRLEKQFNIDSNGALTYRKIVQMPGKSKNELYMMLNDWLSTTFCTSDRYTIRLRDTARGKIVAQGYVQNIAKYDGVVNQYLVSISPIVTCDIKDGRVRVTYSVPFLDVVRLEGGRRGDKDNPPILPEVHHEQWKIEYCYPLYKKDEHKRASSKALVMTYAHSQMVTDRVCNYLSNALAEDNDDDW